jgi:hypothetical protein
MLALGGIYALPPQVSIEEDKHLSRINGCEVGEITRTTTVNSTYSTTFIKENIVQKDSKETSYEYGLYHYNGYAITIIEETVINGRIVRQAKQYITVN